jgi:hypothetical protein
LFTLESYFLFFFVVLAGVAFYYHLSNFKLEDSEQKRLDEAELNLGIVIRLLEQPDTRFLLNQTSTRRFMFVEYSKMLRQDVLSMVRQKELGLKTYTLIGLFYAAFFLLSIKSLIFAQIRDIWFLSGLGLRVYRSTST